MQLFAGTVLLPQALDAVNLTGSELLITSTIYPLVSTDPPKYYVPPEENINKVHLLAAIVHVVMDGVQSGLIGARVTPSRASLRAGGLRRSVVNVVVGSATVISIECVEQAKPMADFVSSRLSQVESSERTSGNTAHVQSTAVDDVVLAAFLETTREVAVAQSTRRAIELVEEIQVEVLVCPLAKTALHGVLVAVDVPAWINGP